MKVAAVIHIDLSGVVEYQEISTGRQEVYARWNALVHCPTIPENVRIDIGDATRVVWSQQLVEILTEVRNVQIAGSWPPAVALAADDLRAAASRPSEAA